MAETPGQTKVTDRHQGPACRVWDEDMYGRRYCRVRYVYGSGS